MSKLLGVGVSTYRMLIYMGGVGVGGLRFINVYNVS